MNASYEWLLAIVPFDYTPGELRDLITARCCPVDELVPLRSDLSAVVVGLVVEASPHPDSDHLWVTKVDAGNGELLDVVCGAPNVQAGHKYPFAPAGSTIPGGLKLEKRKIRGATSNGMLLSARELALGEDHEGILELHTDLPPGTPFMRAMPVGDTRIVIDVTPNRPDLLSHLGVAREIAAANGGRVELPAVQDATVQIPAIARGANEGSAGGIRVRLDDPEGCPRYAGVLIRGVTVGPSPRWLADRVLAIGSRSINNVVDVTNYMLHEVGQPMHAFDATLLSGSTIIIRRARADESIRTLDGVDRKLDASMTVIADGNRAQAIAGVMGGSTSEVSDATRDIFLEVAYFHPATVRRTRSALQLSTDASYRYERGIDIDNVPAALARAAQLLVAVAGGSVEGAPIDLYPAPKAALSIALSTSRVSQLLGEPIAEAETARLLRSVGFAVTGSGSGFSAVTVPSWRPDVSQPVDLIEEVARLRGYDSFSNELRPFRSGTVPDSPLALQMRRVREACVSAGLLEALSMPFVKGAGAPHVRVANPLADDEAYLRRDLLETLARRVEHNLAQRHRDVRLFEIGSVFEPAASGLPREEMRVAAIIMGHRRPPHWSESTTPDIDEWDAKGLAEVMAASVGGVAPLELHPASGDVLWEIRAGGEWLGHVRRLVLDAPVWASPAFGVELRLATISSEPIAPPGRGNHSRPRTSPAGPSINFRPFPSTPSTFFDVALLVPNDMPASRVESTLRSTGGELLESLVLLSEFQGAGIADGFRSIAWRLTFRHPERTLREKELSGRRDKVLRTLEGELGVIQRTT